eukprot:CAMPEP_0206533596 /NCGR_PEP_ID=MMETSP0325_2-20121206/5055_1 /ASSEMBLY_ACC=CAM_ASM_000347 /TAXON_ID=2866 /ORGANISM="Crypthecodinium cohnii, Strain Seligo" /LENGTH=57 /DNA_ID=CAMNT_0054030261 /DNA_START=125 /DNA_END=298 /DNA_ORIENTATION=+
MAEGSDYKVVWLAQVRPPTFPIRAPSRLPILLVPRCGDHSMDCFLTGVQVQNLLGHA